MERPQVTFSVDDSFLHASIWTIEAFSFIMHAMDKAVLEFLNAQRVSVLGVLQGNHTIHSATLHYAHEEDPLAFYVWTGKESRKCRPLLSGKEVNASLVIGFDENEFATFQAEGTVKILIDEKELDEGWKVYGEKLSDRSGGRADQDMVLLRFTPTWWRYTDLKTDPKTEFSSEK